MPRSLGIVGAGIMGRLLAWQLARQGHRIVLFDQDSIKKPGDANGIAAAFTAAGMLAPLSEADSAEEEIVVLGRQSLQLWPDIIDALAVPVDFHNRGSIILAHANDRPDLINFQQRVARLKSYTSNNPNTALQELNHTQLACFEPELATRFNHGIFIADEAWLSPPLMMAALLTSMLQYDVTLMEAVHIEKVAPALVVSNTQSWAFDTVIDCRGLGAKSDLNYLRAVRGETLCLHAPDVQLSHLVRLMHPRYRIYIVPRENNIFVVGATQIESASQAPITVRSALELLSAVYSVHSGFGEAHVLEARVNCRPALPDNLPKVIAEPGLIRVNGLFRHGFLLAPALAQQVGEVLEG